MYRATAGSSLQHLAQGIPKAFIAGSREERSRHESQGTFCFLIFLRSSYSPPERCRKRAGGARGPRRGLCIPDQGPAFACFCLPGKARGQRVLLSPIAHSTALRLRLHKMPMGNLQGNEVFAVYYTQLRIEEEKAPAGMDSEGERTKHTGAKRETVMLMNQITN